MVQFVKSTVRSLKSMKCDISHTNTPITKPFLTFDQKEIYKFSVLANFIPSMEFSFKSTLVCC